MVFKILSFSYLTWTVGLLLSFLNSSSKMGVQKHSLFRFIACGFIGSNTFRKTVDGILSSACILSYCFLLRTYPVDFLETGPLFPSDAI